MLPLLVILASELLVGMPPPLITISSWLPTEEFNWENNEMPPLTEVEKLRTRDSRSIIVPSNIQGLLIVCNASYPIQWDFVTRKRKGDGRRPEMGQLVRTSRRTNDMFNNSTSEYIAELRLHGDRNTLTGNYTCKSVDDPEFIHSNIYFFWEGNSPPYILRFGEKIDIYVEQDLKPKSLTLPCRVSLPSIPVSLEKQNNQTWTKINVNLDHPEMWSFDPRVGFVAHNIEDSEAVGSYRCSTDSHEDDVASFNVHPGPAPPKEEFREIMLSNASFSYHEENKKFVCCSTSWRRPSFQLISCENPTLCLAARLSMDSQPNNRANHGKRVLENSCSSIKLIYQTSGILRCIGDGIQIYKEYFFEETVGIANLIHHSKFQIPFEITGSPYYHWTDANPERMISVAADSKTMFSGEAIRVSCQASNYYFAQGVKWLITWKNNSQRVQDGIENTFLLRTALFLHPGYSYLTFMVDSGMRDVSCYAPVWNSTLWFHKSLPLDIKEPIGPSIDGSTMQDQFVKISWYLNDTAKFLQCSIDGNPMPTIVWHLNDKVLHESRHENGTSTLKIDHVQSTSNGNYTCTAHNLAGSITKTFQVTVLTKTSSGQIAGIVCIVIVAVLLFIALGFLVKHVRSQAHSIKHLKTIAFKDVIDRTNEDPPHVNFPFPSPPATISVSDLESISNSHTQDEDQKIPKFKLHSAVNHVVGYEKF